MIRNLMSKLKEVFKRYYVDIETCGSDWESNLKDLLKIDKDSYDKIDKGGRS